MARTVSYDLQMTYPKPLSPIDVIPERAATLHVCGFFRALASALDCLSATMIGALAIPQAILKADFALVRAWLAGSRNPSQTRSPFHTAFSTELDALIFRAGPSGWTDWIVDYRNMLVHRGRRTELNMLRLESHLVDAIGRPIPHAVPVLLLARDPHLSDVQAQLVTAVNVIREPATDLMPAVLESTRYLVDEVCAHLVKVWRDRRAGTLGATQPTEQWPAIVGSSKPFVGYQDKKMDVSPDLMMTGSSGPTRIQAACLDSERRHLWEEGLTD